MSVPASRFADPPLLVVTDVAARLVRRGLLTPADAAGTWRSARVIVFRSGPVVCDPPPGARGIGTHRVDLSIGRSYVSAAPMTLALYNTLTRRVRSRPLPRFRSRERLHHFFKVANCSQEHIECFRTLI